MKVNLAPEVAFLRSIPANALVCACLLLCQSARDMIGKMVRRPPPPSAPAGPAWQRSDGCGPAIAARTHNLP